MKKLFFLWLSFTIGGCSYHTPSKGPVTPFTYKETPYRSAESVGNLRRLALMPIEIESQKRGEGSAENEAAAAASYEDACVTFLTEKKGYEIVVFRQADGALQEGVLADSGYSNIQEFSRKMREGAEDARRAELIHRIDAALHVDGLLVVRIKERKPWGTAEGLLNIALLNVPLFYTIASPNIGAWIYETATGRLVWRLEYSSAASSSYGERMTAAESVFRLFADLDNAVPRQLIQ